MGALPRLEPQRDSQKYAWMHLAQFQPIDRDHLHLAIFNVSNGDARRKKVAEVRSRRNHSIANFKVGIFIHKFDLSSWATL